MRAPLCLFLTLLAPTLTSCMPQNVQIEPRYVPTTRPTSFDYADSSLVLNRAAQPDGVDYAAIIAAPAPLQRFLGKLSVGGPQSTPDLFPRPADRIAYDINAYNAAVMYG